MSGALSLNGTWDLTCTEGVGVVRMNPDYYTGPTLQGKGLLQVRVPAPVHEVLREAGLLEDPTYGLNSLRARWVEEMYWIYRRRFEVPLEATEQRAWLTFQCLELHATIYLNGERIGHHANANRAARFEITGRLRAGENLLAVKLETGIHAMADKPAGDYGWPALTKRQFLRNPQYQHGIDWNPRLVNVGILGNVSLEWRPGPRLDQVTVFAVPSTNLSRATITVRATIDGAREPMPATLRVRIRETGQEETLAIEVHPGEQRQELRLDLVNPRLWWPAGHGEQCRYTIEVSLEAGVEVQTVTLRTGVRLVELDQSPHPMEGRFFILTINQRPIFCKGANWCPPDLFYSTVEDARYRHLVQLAAEAHFNFFRIWGGGLFVTPALAEACDEAGILLWHDFPFSCAKYPGDDPAFAVEVRREVTWAVRELAHHPSLVIWCGNNEVEWFDWRADLAYDQHYPIHPHYVLFHHDIPRIVRTEDASKLYWPSSPFSPDYEDPNEPSVGDQHPWGVSIFDTGVADWWHYRGYVDRFANEGGVLGVSPLATLRQFLPESERSLLSPSWEHHDNVFGMGAPGEPGALGRAYATVAFWTGRDPLAMDWEEYAFVSALLQAEGLAEFAANYRRRMFSCAAAAFWSYNDSWPVTHGWTIVDYYLRKKLAYFTVRRLFQPVAVVVAEEAGQVTVFGINDRPEAWTGELRYGLFALDGGWPRDQRQAVSLPANASTPLAQFSRAEWEAVGLERSGAGAVLMREGQHVAQHRLFLARFKDLALTDPKITLHRRGGELTLASDAYAWGVCLDVEGDVPVPDNCFDLLPGVPYTIPWSDSLGEPQVVRFGNRDAVKPQPG